MNKFRQWYLTNQKQITWFVVGWLSLSALQNLVKGQYTYALVDVVLISLNVMLNK
jgi:hypothetical protein